MFELLSGAVHHNPLAPSGARFLDHLRHLPPGVCHGRLRALACSGVAAEVVSRQVEEVRSIGVVDEDTDDVQGWSPRYGVHAPAPTEVLVLLPTRPGEGHAAIAAAKQAKPPTEEPSPAVAVASAAAPAPAAAATETAVLRPREFALLLKPCDAVAGAGLPYSDVERAGFASLFKPCDAVAAAGLPYSDAERAQFASLFARDVTALYNCRFEGVELCDVPAVVNPWRGCDPEQDVLGRRSACGVRPGAPIEVGSDLHPLASICYVEFIGKVECVRSVVGDALYGEHGHGASRSRRSLPIHRVLMLPPPLRPRLCARGPLPLRRRPETVTGRVRRRLCARLASHGCGCRRLDGRG